MYDPQLGRWHRMDPMAENHFNMTPYNYVLNNPLIYIDLFGLDTTIVLEPVVCVGQRRIKVTPRIQEMIWENSSTSQSNYDSGSSNSLPPKWPVAVADATSVIGFLRSSGVEFQELTGLKLGELSGGRYRVYGSTFFGNQSTKIVKLTKAVKIGGILVSAVLVSADLYDAYFNGKVGAEQAAAEQRLITDILIVGVYAINAEAGLLITAGQILMNSEEVQRGVQQELERKREKQGIWSLPQGPIYFEQGD